MECEINIGTLKKLDDKHRSWTLPLAVSGGTAVEEISGGPAGTYDVTYLLR